MLRALPTVLALVAFWSLGGAFVSAEPPKSKMPPHQALRRPAVYPNNPAISQPVVVKAQPYPYGYFGTTPARGHWSSHFGYYENYTQWTRR